MTRNPAGPDTCPPAPPSPPFRAQAHLDQYLSAQEQLNASAEVMQRMEALLMAPGVEEVMATRRMYSLQVQVWRCGG